MSGCLASGELAGTGSVVEGVCVCERGLGLSSCSVLCRRGPDALRSMKRYRWEEAGKLIICCVRRLTSDENTLVKDLGFIFRIEGVVLQR